MKPTEFRQMTRAKLRKLARQGRLIDTAFKVFCEGVFPAAGPEQRNALRIAFFAGAAELIQMQYHAVDDGVDETEGDLDFYGNVHDEIERFHRRTLEALRAAEGPSGKN